MPEIFQDGPLTLELCEEAGAIIVHWKGRSTAREPGKFILRVLTHALERTAAGSKPLILDFQDIGYMNSSTITPLIRVLDRAKHSKDAITVVYKRDLKWQDLNFSALQVFQTSDHRIEIRGV